MKKHEIKNQWLDLLCDKVEIDFKNLDDQYKSFLKRFEESKTGKTTWQEI